jgi:hypothetical protein
MKTSPNTSCTTSYSFLCSSSKSYPLACLAKFRQFETLPYWHHGMVAFFFSLKFYLLSLKFWILNYFLRVKEDAWQICVEHFTAIWCWSSRSQRVNAMQLQLWGTVIFVRFLRYFNCFFFGLVLCFLVACMIHIPILVTSSCIFLACMLVFYKVFYISRFALDYVGLFFV